jgi:acyl-CoA synthetase (AMP-forming)/AMP-acid ligase II
MYIYTGKPKGVLHGSGGYLLHATLSTKHSFDLRVGIFMYICRCIYICICIYITYMYVYVYMYVDVDIYVYVYRLVDRSGCLSSDAVLYICTYLLAYIYTYI